MDTNTHIHKKHTQGSKMSCDRPLQRVGPAGQVGHTVTPTGPRCAGGTATSCFPLETSAWATTARQGLAPPILILYLVSACTHAHTCVRVLVRTTDLIFFVFCNNEDYKKGFDYSILAEVFINLHKLAPNRYSRMLNPFCSAHSQVQEHTL